jgi:tRNA (mo5U34)-methyltransferase
VNDQGILFDNLAQMGLGSWREPLGPLLSERFSDSAHGDIRKWRGIIDNLPEVCDTTAKLDSPAVTIASPSVDATLRNEIKDLLLQLRPWRKGPFNIFGIDLDTEWRSDLKWDRLRNEIAPLTDRRVLDVGCGNGYYALRMLGGGARLVVGIDPTLLFVFQFEALRHFLDEQPAHVLPLRLHELPDARNAFDTTFSMGVLYHQRDPLQHLAELRETLRPGGELILETLILPGSDSQVREPDDRYARMRNVWHLPTVTVLQDWLQKAGFFEIRLVDVTVTTTDEQRSTEWMPFESLAEALDPGDPGLTIEGWPAPRRALLVSRAP